MRSSVSKEVKSAVDAVFGEACYYGGDYINAVYHSVSCGTTASAKSVWGTNLPYLQPVDSEYDELSPYYESSWTSTCVPPALRWNTTPARSSLSSPPVAMVMV